MPEARRGCGFDVWDAKLSPSSPTNEIALAAHFRSLDTESVPCVTARRSSIGMPHLLSASPNQPTSESFSISVFLPSSPAPGDEAVPPNHLFIFFRMPNLSSQ